MNVVMPLSMTAFERGPAVLARLADTVVMKATTGGIGGYGISVGTVFLHEPRWPLDIERSAYMRLPCGVLALSCTDIVTSDRWLVRSLSSSS